MKVYLPVNPLVLTDIGIRQVVALMCDTHIEFTPGGEVPLSNAKCQGFRVSVLENSRVIQGKQLLRKCN